MTCPPLIAALFEAHGVPAPSPEYPFASPREYRFDYAWPEEGGGGIALEIEGGVFGRGKACPVCRRKRGGAHSSISGIKRDIAKYNLAAVLGWFVLRALPEELQSGAAAALVKRAMG